MATVAEALAAGLAHFQAGRHERAQAIWRQVLAFDPDQPDALKLLGVVEHALDRPAAAVPLLARALDRAPGDAETAFALGTALEAVGRQPAAVTALARALALAPGHAGAHANLADLLRQAGQGAGQGGAVALAHFRCAVGLAPDSALYQHKCAAALQAAGDLDGAISHYAQAVALDPADADARYNLGTALNLPTGRLDDAAAALSAALALRPDRVEAHNNLGSVRQSLGLIGDALASYRRALDLDPAGVMARINLVFTGLFDPALTPRALAGEIAAFARRHAPAVARRRFANPRDPERRLRIGYLSANLRRSSTGLNLEPLYAHHDHERFEIVSYAQGAIADDMTARFRAWSDVWRPIAGLSDAAVADLIRGDGIDVLVSVAGWFDGNRPLVCAGRAAPVQVSYYDAASSGLAAMDYWLSDGFLHPAGTVDPHTEELVRVPHLLAYGVPEGTPAVGPVPSQGPAGPGFGSGRVRFGSCNNPAKIGRAVIGVWGRILAAVPGSVMVLKYLNWYGNAGVRGRYERAFGDVGIGPDRLEFDVAGGDRGRHLGFVTGIDVGLDPWPFNGCTTTFEALWMGVPVVTLAGERYVSRMSGSLLHTLGLGDLIARDEDGYVGTAVSLAGDVGRRAALRGELRGRLRGSLICAGPAYAGSLEAAYRGLWRRWCDGDG
jgi:predicted O-linked N-acetylglucosamine transferase (SPINDLY family)